MKPDGETQLRPTAAGHPDPGLGTSSVEYVAPVGPATAPVAYPYIGTYYGGIYGAYSGQPLVNAALMAMPPHSVPLVTDAVVEPIYVNARQYHGILRRRQSRAKAESENKANKIRKHFYLTKPKRRRLVLVGAMDELGIIEQGVDWRTRLGQDIRDNMTYDILFSLQTKLQITSTKLIDLQKVAARIEERIHTIASDYGDYLRRICLTRGDLDSYDALLNNCQRRQASILSSVLLHQENKQGDQIIQAERNIKGASSSSVLSNQVTLNDHKEHSHPYGKDMISKLPNDLFQHIMSFLSMREAVRTSVLSHWWVNRWTFLQSIQLNIYWFHMDREKFSSFLDKLLLSRVHADAPIDTFELNSFAIDRANCWINHAIKHNAKVLKFAEYERWEPFYLDPNLVELSSRYLETLELTNVALDATIFNPLNNACPALQNMLLTDCLLEVEEISSSSLKNLDIIDCSLLKDLSICTPSLVSLCIKDERTDNSSFRNSYLIFATVTIIDASSVSSMELSAMDRQFTFVEKDGGEPMFRNLRILRLGLWCIDNMFSPLRRFVLHSPMLRMVTLRLSLLDWKFQITEEHEKTLVGIRDRRGLILYFDWY